MSLSHYPAPKLKTAPTGTTEFEILKASHKFLRDDDDADEDAEQSWNDKMATKYYSSLYREFAVCDLKHYKSGEFALRWRTESEVLSGAGETTCGNSRCKHHEPPSRPEKNKKTKALTTLELPFAYVEHGEQKSALVKVVLCEKCLNKLMWKRRKDKEKQEINVKEEVKQEDEEAALLDVARRSTEPQTNDERNRRRRDQDHWDRDRKHREEPRRRDSRSRSPHRGPAPSSSRYERPHHT